MSGYTCFVNYLSASLMKLKLRSLHLSWFLFLFIFSSVNSAFSQAILKFGGTATYIKMSNGPIYLVVGNAAAGAITGASSTAGWIISEGQYNYVKWLGATNTTYTIPFGYSTSDYLPLTFGQTAGSPANLTVSTYATGNTNTPWAAGVGNMNNISTGVDGSVGYVIDRWWTINSSATATLGFSYRGAENTMTATPTGTLGIQHWDGTKWNDGNGGSGGSVINTGTAGSQEAGAHSVSSGATTFNQFSPYVLVSFVSPLPVTFLYASTECDHGNITIKWSTASEQNSDYFTVERSLDGANYSSIATVKAAANSSTTKNYSAVDHDGYSGTSFYRIKETDFNGNFMYSSTLITSGCNTDNIIIYGTDGGASININALEDARYNVEMYDVLGQKMVNEVKNVVVGNNHVKLDPGNIASAIYIVKVYNSNNAVTKKVFIRSKM